MKVDCKKFSIVVGGQVIGPAPIGKISYIPIGSYDCIGNEIEPKHEEPGKSWDISCNALVKEGDLSDALKDMLPGPQTVDVQITRPIGKIPRKMKKADKRDPSGITKFGRKVLSYRRRHTTTVNNAEMVVTQQDKETLTLTITKATESAEQSAHVSGEDIKRALERYSKHH